jgi:hypothetical protein
VSDEANPTPDPVADVGEQPDIVFEALWAKVVESWDDDKPHQALLQHALTAQMLPELAGRYRRLKDDPDKGARAQKKIDAIVVAATQMLMATKSPPRTKTPLSWTLSAALFFALVIAFLLYKLMLGR